MLSHFCSSLTCKKSCKHFQFRSQKQFRFPGPSSTCAGCFAAGTGFLLNFTIREHPPGTKHHRRTSASGTDRPLAPDQHRLTDDGGSSVSSPGKAVLKEDDKAHEVESLTPGRQEQDSQQSSLPQTSHPQPLLGAMAQIKVPLSVDLEIVNQVDLPAIRPLLSLDRRSSALRAKGQNGLCLLPSNEDKFKDCIETASLCLVQDLAVSREFRKYMAMCIITVNLKAIFRHLDATLPKYQVRCASEARMPLVSCALSLKGATQMHYLVQEVHSAALHVVQLQLRQKESMHSTRSARILTTAQGSAIRAMTTLKPKLSQHCLKVCHGSD